MPTSEEHSEVTGTVCLSSPGTFLVPGGAAESVPRGLKEATLVPGLGPGCEHLPFQKGSYEGTSISSPEQML